MIILNVVLAYALWKVADMYFDIGRTTIGWLCVAMSAMNFASFMAEIV
jgi:hypothetical protein